MKCVSSKTCYSSRALAEEALIEVRGRYHFRDGSGPIAVYQCDDCGAWHFTSKGPADKLLGDEEVKDRIDKQREAEHWLRKLGGR